MEGPKNGALHVSKIVMQRQKEERAGKGQKAAHSLLEFPISRKIVKILKINWSV